MFAIFLYPALFLLSYFCLKKNAPLTSSEKNVEFLKNGILIYALSKMYPDDFNGEDMPELVQGIDTSIKCLEFVLPEFEHAKEHNEKINNYLTDKFENRENVYDFFEKMVLKFEKGISPQDVEEYESIEQTINELESAVEGLRKKTRLE